MTEEAKDPKTEKSITVREFLEGVPSGRNAQIIDFEVTDDGFRALSLKFPIINLYCEAEFCGGYRYFDPPSPIVIQVNQRFNRFIKYTCRNCRSVEKEYAISMYVNSDKKSGEILKYGEVPSFGPPTPAKVITLIGPEREYFLKGRRSENQGLGIAAFAYYRRAIENQKNRIIDEIIRVSEKIGAGAEMIEELRAAKDETQFSNAVAVLKHGIPQALLINGHNPLTLLHSALSEGLHAQSDEQCLELATSIRILLVEFAEKLSNALKEEAELKGAVNRLLNSRDNKKTL